jgi:glycosyltransferase involved in cell wall biosynthesis
VGKTRWPWTVEPAPLPPTLPGNKLWPRITVVTPSYNQGQYLGETLRPVLLQGYPNLEYIVIDGGSRDNSVAIIEKYAPFLDF